MSKTVEMTESGNYFFFVYIFDGQGGGGDEIWWSKIESYGGAVSLYCFF
jgi:hypothetical protein